MSARLGVPVRYVHNPIDLNLYPFQAEKGNRYLSLNRIMKEKMIHEFIALIKRTRSYGDVVGLDVGGLITDISYVERVREDCDGYLVRYFGLVNHERKVKLLQNAKATICLAAPPSTGWMEVFGLAALESAAVGTPVIAMRSGGLPEIVEDGKTGCVCDTLESVEKAIREDAVSSIKPEDCRKKAEEFSYKIIAGKYLGLYEEIVNNGRGW
jgi:glycosyltransferase involved in cell wall biosynthesis